MGGVSDLVRGLVFGMKVVPAWMVHGLKVVLAWMVHSVLVCFE
jgi:hypothetical protein